MKRIILLFLICLFPLNVKASLCVMDTDTKRLLSSYGEDEVRLIASTTKIMTSLVVINNVDDLNEVVEVPESVLKSFGSGIYIEVGEHIKVIDLLYGLMLRSGNDAAITLADYVGGSMEGFALLMNEYAKNIGMLHTNFINSSGLENEEGEGNTSTCYDMALLMSEATKNKTLMKIMSTKHYIVKTDYKAYDWHNKNKLLTQYKYTTGGKTGYTKKAYRTLVTSATKDHKNLAVVTLGEKDDFAKHQQAYEAAFKKYKLVNVVNAKTFLKKEGYQVNKDINMLLTEDEIKKVKVDVTYTNDIRSRSGYVTVSLNNKTYYQEDFFLRKEKKNVMSVISNFFYSLFH